MRAADAAALSTVSEETLVGAGRDRRRPRRVAPPRRRVRPPRDRGRRQGQQRRRRARRRRASWPGAGRGSRWSPPPTRPAALRRCDLVIDGAYGTGFRGAYDAPAVPPGVPVLSDRHPLGRGRRHRRGAGRAVPGHPHGDLRGLQARAPARSRCRAAAATVQVVDIGIPLSAERAPP